MSHDPNSDLSRAIAALSIAQLWRAAGLRGQPPSRDGAVASPFREDKKASFSIFGQGARWRDHATEEGGGVWAFAQQCWPHDPKAEIAERLIALSGVPRNAPQSRLSSEQWKTKATIERDAAAHRVAQEREAALARRGSAAEIPEWPDFVRDRWIEGESAVLEDRARLTKLATDRGWPIDWAEQLVVAGKLASPWLPWSGPECREPRRGRACLVEQPRLSGDGSVAECVPVGYHQRFWIDGAKQWVYVPHRPKESAWRREGFAAQLEDYAATQPEDRSLVPALPFFLGSLEPEWVCITEGQWDAITLAGAVGYFDDSWGDRRVAFFGVRGVSGIEVLLTYWSAWLAQWRPRVWLLCDADNAGRKWRERDRSGVPGGVAPPTLAERLEAAGARSVKVSVLRSAAVAETGKDFNDWWRVVRPTRWQIENWLKNQGVFTT